MSNLFSDDEDATGGSKSQLTINEHYAKAFEYRKEREELERRNLKYFSHKFLLSLVKAKYGSDYDPDGSGSEFSTDSESAESEDEDGEELTPIVDAAILRTLARIRKKDPAIYDSQKNIYGEEQERLHSTIPRTNAKQTKSNKRDKPLTVRQVNLDAMLNPSRTPSPEAEQHPLTHVEEQDILRKETIAAFHGAADNQDEDDFLIPREKTQDEREREEEEYRAFLEREVGDLREVVSVDDLGDEEKSGREEGQENEDGKDEEGKKRKKKKKSKKAKDEKDANNEPSSGKQKKTKAEKDQEFLMNYILNRGWIDRSTGHVPTYGEITSPGEERRKKKGKAKAEPRDDSELDGEKSGNIDDEMDAGLLSDTSFESLASHFEASYNHRFEEPGAATIASFPRILPSVVRRQDTTRKEARERRKERKEDELRKRQEEVKRMKALKMREIKRKLERIGREGGLKIDRSNDDDNELVDGALKELDLEGDWDPEKHDLQMAGLFDRDTGFEEDDDAWAGEFDDDVEFDQDGKPKWEDEIDIGDIAVPDDDAVVFDEGSGRRKEKKKEKRKKKKMGNEDEDEGAVDIDAMDADAEPQQEGEEWDGTEEMRKRKLNEYMDEVYGLDFNDIVGGLPTRFRYVPVQPQNYALTPVEILLATDQELNEYVSVKKYAPYRHDKGDRYRWNKKDQEKLHELKSTIKNRSGNAFGIRTMAGGHGPADGSEKKRKGKKERMKAKVAL
ncbi:Krr1-domain-containing protein, partial [Phlegmacium glaucopus]